MTNEEELERWRILAKKTHEIYLETLMEETTSSSLRWFLEKSKELYPELEKVYAT